MQHTSFYTFSERLEFEALKPEKTALKNLNEKETGNLKMKNLKPLKELLSSHFTIFYQKFSQMNRIIVKQDLIGKTFQWYP